MFSTIIIVAVVAALIASSGGIAICVIGASVRSFTEITVGAARKGMATIDLVNPLRLPSRGGVPSNEGFYTRAGAVSGMLSLALAVFIFALPNLVGHGLAYDDWKPSLQSHVVRIANSALTATRTGGSVEIGLQHSEGTQITSECEVSSLVTTMGTTSTVLIAISELEGMSAVHCLVTSTARSEVSAVKAGDIRIHKGGRKVQDHMWMLLATLLCVSAVVLSACYRAGYLMRRYDRWMKGWEKEIEAITAPLINSDPDRYVQVIHALNEGRTRDLFTLCPEIYGLPQKPPNLWNSRARLASAINTTVLLLMVSICVVVVVIV